MPAHHLTLLRNCRVPLDLTIFTTDLRIAKLAVASGIDRVIVDWETAGKTARQAGYSTQINADSPEQVRALSGLSIPVLVRIDHQSQSQVERDIEIAIDCGAESIMLPMATGAKQVQHFVDTVAERARCIVQIETQALVEEFDQLGQIAWDTAYIGLNDLMISRQDKWIWRPILDGTVDHIFDSLQGRKVGFGGVTVVGRGSPLPFTALFAEMARLGCAMSFLRRSFLADIPDRNVAAEIAAVRALWHALTLRGADAVAQDHDRFIDLLHQLDPNALRLPNETNPDSLAS